SFTGTASDITPVTIKIYEGEGTGGKLLATASASGTGGSWTSGPASAELPAGNHVFTATATQASSISGNPEGTSAPASLTGNPEGKSAEILFTIDTKAPAVSMNAVQTPTNNPAPELSGGLGTEAGDHGSVSVSIYKGSSVTGAAIPCTASVEGTPPSKWKCK